MESSRRKCAITWTTTALGLGDVCLRSLQAHRVLDWTLEGGAGRYTLNLQIQKCMIVTDVILPVLINLVFKNNLK